MTREQELQLWRHELIVLLDFRIMMLEARDLKEAFAEMPYLCGACIEGRPQDCSGWCANYHAGITG